MNHPLHGCGQEPTGEEATDVTSAADADTSVTGSADSAGRRVRDPARRAKILDAAAQLIGQTGYHSVSMGDIGHRAGITGSGIYRHFDSKSTILVELFDRIVDSLNKQQSAILRGDHPLREQLTDIVRVQMRFVIDQREVAKVYYSELHNLPEADQIRLRRKQRLYLEEWVHLLMELRPELADVEARILVHAAIGAMQSPLFHRVGLDSSRLSALITDSAFAVMGLS